MTESTQQSSTPSALRILFMSSFVPRECGIATYTEDVIHAVAPQGAHCQVLAMERPGETCTYDPRVIGTVQEDDWASYRAAAARINSGEFDVLSVQHEFGLYGGEESDLLVRFLRLLRIPVVVTFHTVLQEPSEPMRRNQQHIGHLAAGIVVMNGLALEVLRDVYGIDAAKITVTHHGAPVPPYTREERAPVALGLDEGTRVISTFGLITPAKGLEYMVQAMPRIADAVPDAVYYILGQTHPVLRATEGESYRGMLENLAHDLGVLSHVRFVDRYLEKSELVSYLLATETYVTPYLNLEQVTSGTLAYALGAGCPVVATPYLHARYLLADGRGMLVPPRDPEGLADAVINILTDPTLQASMEQNNWEYGQALYWPRVGEDYLGAFLQAARGR